MKKNRRKRFWEWICKILAMISSFLNKSKKEKSKSSKSKKEEKLTVEQQFEEKLNEQKRHYESELGKIKNSYQTQIIVLKEKYDTERIRHKDQELELQERLNNANQMLETVYAKLKLQKKKLSLIQALHPEFNFEQELQEMRAPEAILLKHEFEQTENAREENDVVKRVYDEIKLTLENITEGNYNTYSDLNRVYCKYKALTAEQRENFSDKELISKLEEILKVAEEDYNDFKVAKDAEKKSRAIIDTICYVNKDYCDDILDALEYYNNLSVSQQRYFDTDLWEKMENYLIKAEEDNRRVKVQHK